MWTIEGEEYSSFDLDSYAFEIFDSLQTFYHRDQMKLLTFQNRSMTRHLEDRINRKNVKISIDQCDE